jgi:NADPH-dependent 2,4-dienoyl-CoA reductase/sulfur reductase-like enzyme
MKVVLLDEQVEAGGQIYRGVDAASLQRRSVLGEDYAAGAELTASFNRCGATHIRGASVWNVSRDMAINYLQGGRNHTLRARHIVLASGAMERPFPIPGWTLPGVMGAGAAQILFKSSGALPTEPVVLAGCGPLLYLLASQYLNAGLRIKALVHTTAPGDYLRALRHTAAAVRGWKDLRKGMRMMATLRRHKVQVLAGATSLAIEGEDRAQALSFLHDGRRQWIETGLVLLHQGVVPNTQLSQSLRFPHRWNESQLCWEPVTDADGQLEKSGIFVAGDSRGIVGARASASQGQLAAIAIADLLNLPRQAERKVLRVTARDLLKDQVALRPFIDALYRPPDAHRIPANDKVIVCRCEEVTAGDIRRYAAHGCQGPNQTKAFGRCGMGPCQGRFCGLTVTEMLANARSVPPQCVGYYRIRPPIKPVTLAELAG